MKLKLAAIAILAMASGCTAPTTTDYVWEKGLAVETGVYVGGFSYTLYSDTGNVIQQNTYQASIFTLAENPYSPAVNINDSWVGTNTPDGQGSGNIIIATDTPQLAVSEPGINIWWRQVASGSFVPVAGVLTSGNVMDAYFLYHADPNDSTLPDMSGPTVFAGWDVQKIWGIHRVQPGEAGKAVPLTEIKRQMLRARGLTAPSGR